MRHIKFIIIIIIVFPLHFAWFVSGSWGFINLLSPHNRYNRPFACCAGTDHWSYTSAILNSTKKKIIVSFVLDRLPEMSADSEEVCKTLTKSAWRSLSRRKKSDQRAQAFFVEDYVHALFVTFQEAECCVLKGKCFRLMSKSDKPHEMKMILEFSEWGSNIVFRRCSCKAG